MKVAVIVLATLSLAAADGAMASSRLSDVDYLKANRCRGIAAGLGVSDTASLDALLKTEGRTRPELIVERAQDEFARAKREASKGDSKDRLSAELNGPCMALVSGDKDAASAR
ncbi:hypothetical protein [Phenylobacterium sp.]|jgi:hypothetical protein|uniref:hypothetical protein n=1 Tax=Phenylobacterium sp. TaxID=1871053 RepID=UPI002F3FA3C5